MTQKTHDLPDTLLLTCPEVARMVSCSERSIHAWSRAGVMPAPVKIGRSTRWLRKAIIEWIDKGCPLCEPNRTGREEAYE